MSDTTIPKDARSIAFEIGIMEHSGLIGWPLKSEALIESYVAERERIAREETARKCAEVAVIAFDDWAKCRIITDSYKLKEARQDIHTAIMDAAKGDDREIYIQHPKCTIPYEESKNCHARYNGVCMNGIQCKPDLAK